MPKSQPTPAPDMSGIADLTNAMMLTNPAIAKAWTDIMTEGARFVSERLNEDLEAQKALLLCTKPADVVKLQSEFLLKAMTDYTQEMQRMTQIMTDAGNEIAKEASQTWSRAYDDVPL